MELIILGFITSFFTVLLATPSLIKVAKLKHLVDEPGDERKLHRKRIPTIGGIIIFSAILFSYALWFPDEADNMSKMMSALNEFKYLVASLLILFFVGVKDDIIGTSPVKKLVAHMIVAFILVMMADIRITSMHGLFGLDGPLPEWGSVFLSVFVYIVVVNAFNLIDGIDGLAAGIGMINGLLMGLWFYFCGNVALALLAFTLSGALLGFLVFNFSPAKIFMGDSGSLTIGMIISVLAIRMIEIPSSECEVDFLQGISTPVLAMSVLAYPLLDTLRIFVYRAVKGQSPFSADKNHIHHKLLRLGSNHARAVLVLYGFTFFVVGVCALTGQLESPTLSFIITLSSAILFVGMILLMKDKKS